VIVHVGAAGFPAGFAVLLDAEEKQRRHKPRLEHGTNASLEILSARRGAVVKTDEAVDAFRTGRPTKGAMSQPGDVRAGGIAFGKVLARLHDEDGLAVLRPTVETMLDDLIRRRE